MGLIERVLTLLFGNGGSVIKDTAGVFFESPEAAATRNSALQQAVLAQFAAEFASQPKPGLFDRMIDGLNRLPRPAMALGTLGLFVSAMFNPIWFAERMQGIALVPEPMWWLMGAVVSFYFGARHQAKGMAFQRSVAQTVARVPTVTSNLRALQALDEGAMVAAPASGPNPALDDWRGAQ